MSNNIPNIPDTKIVERLSFEACANSYEDIYVASELVMLHCYRDSFHCYDLVNAGKRGEVCKYAAGCFDSEKCEFLNIMADNEWRARSLFTPEVIAKFKYGEVRETKAHKIFSPFNTPPRLKALPKRWNIESVRRALSNNQVKDCFYEVGFDGMTDGHTHPHEPCDAGCVLRDFNRLSYGVQYVDDDGRVHVGNSASAYSFMPSL